MKLAVIGLLGGFGVGLNGVLKEWRKPVLTAQVVTTTATAPRIADDPLMLLAGSAESVNVHLTQLTVATNHNTDALRENTEANEALRTELYISRETNKNLGQ